MKMKKIVATVLLSATLAACAPALSGCSSGEVKFTLSEDGGHYIVSFSGISSSYGEYEIPAYYGDDNIPVTEIADEGFASTNFSKIIVPSTVTTIGTAAFSFCNSLKTVEFEEGIQLEKFSHGMFGESSNLEEIAIPDSVKNIGPLAFSGCTSLSTVDLGSVESIGIRAFEKCTSLEEITLPSTLITIGTLAFFSTGLKEIEIPDSVHATVKVDDEDNEITVYGLGYASFLNCTSLESAKIGKGVTVIASGAFGYCNSLKEVHVPLSVKEVQGALYSNGTFYYGHAFYHCPELKYVYYEGSEDDWTSIKIATDNDYKNGVSMDNSALLNAVKHYNNK